MDYLQICQTLLRHKVDFIVVGGFAAVVQGAPINTFDLDVVHSRDRANLPRLLTAINELDGFYRLQPELRLRPDESHLSSPDHQLLATRFGPVDFLGTIGNQLTYDELLPLSEERTIGPDITVRVLHLATLIRLKEELGRDKDLAVLNVLRRTLAESQRP